MAALRETTFHKGNELSLTKDLFAKLRRMILTDHEPVWISTREALELLPGITTLHGVRYVIKEAQKAGLEVNRRDIGSEKKKIYLWLRDDIIAVQNWRVRL